MSKEDIAEYLSIAYALHVSNCKANGLNPTPYTDFVECYKYYIPDFRRDIGAGDPITG